MPGGFGVYAVAVASQLPSIFRWAPRVVNALSRATSLRRRAALHFAQHGVLGGLSDGAASLSPLTCVPSGIMSMVHWACQDSLPPGVDTLQGLGRRQR
jgi:hypothetical protein